MSINPYAALCEGANPNEHARPNEDAGPNEGQQVLLQTYNVGPSSRDGGPLRRINVGLAMIDDGLTDVGGFRPHPLPARADPFNMPRKGSFALPVTFEVLDPDILSAANLVTGYTSIHLSVSLGNCVLSHVQGMVNINPSKTSYEQVMHQIIAVATNLTGLVSLTSHRQDWMWVVLAQGPLFLEKVTIRTWDEVWPILGHQTFKLTIYLIEVCPDGKEIWETWQRPLIV